MEDDNDANSTEGEDAAGRQEGVLPPPEGFGIRRNLRRTSVEHRDDAMTLEMYSRARRIFEEAEVLLSFAYTYQMLTFLLQSVSRQALARGCVHLVESLQKASKYSAMVSAALLSWVHLHYLDFEDVVYYPLLRRQPPPGSERFTPVRNTRISELSDATAYRLTGYNCAKLRRLKAALRIHDNIPPSDPLRPRFDGEEMLLYLLAFMRHAPTYLDMSNDGYFGGDPRRFTYAMRTIVDYLYTVFYHKITGDSMRQWMPLVGRFRRAILRRLQGGPHQYEVEFDPGLVSQEYQDLFGDEDSHRFLIFGFLDDYGVETCSVGPTVRRRLDLEHDLQRAFYSGYFRAHGLKAQVVYLPNGMVGSVFIASIAQNDNGMQNLSGLNAYLCRLLQTANLWIGASLPALYGDGIFARLPTIIPRFTGRDLTDIQIRKNRRLASVRVAIEHLLGLHCNLFALFDFPRRLSLFNSGEHIVRMLMVSFLLLNCYNCINQSSSAMFDLEPPSLEQYLPVDEVLPSAPVVTDEQLGTVYYYGDEQ